MTHLEKYYRANRKDLVAKFTNSLGHHNAEDLVQDAYLKLLEEKVDDEEFDEALERSLQAVVRSMYRDIRNRGVVRERLTEETIPEAIDEERVWLVNQINDLFSNNLRDAIIEVAVNNEPTAAIAKECGLNLYSFKKELEKLRRHREDRNIRHRNEWTTSQRR